MLLNHVNYFEKNQELKQKPDKLLAAAFTLQGLGSTTGIYYLPFRPFGLRFVTQTRPPCIALYAVSVRRPGTLPPASFRFRLTTDTLALG